MISFKKHQSYASIYIGYGFKATASVFFPKEPQKIQAEPKDIDEQLEVCLISLL
jgi:hypothetical protein